MVQSVRILHVDDDPEFAALTTEFLEREGEDFEVVTETDASDALARLEDERVDCIVSDYRMPGTDGLELLDAVRETYPDLPFILFTNQGSEEVAAEAIEKGVTSYLRKETADTVQYTRLANRVRTHVEKHHAEHRARRLEREYKLVARTATDVFWTLDRPAETMSFSDGLEHFGYDPAETNPAVDVEWFFERIHPDDRERIRRRYEALLAREASAFDETTTGRGEFSNEFRFRRADGTYADCHGRGIVVFDDDGNGDGNGGGVDEIVGAITDITDRKDRERELERERDRRAALFENTPDPIMEVDFENGEAVIDGINAAFEDTFGIDAGAAAGRTVADVVVPDAEREEHERLRDRVFRGEPVETEVRRQTAGGVREFLLRIIPFDVSDVSSGAYAWYTDITERKERERELKRYERIVREMNDGVVVVQDGEITDTNPEVSEITGYGPEQLEDSPMGEFIAPEDRDTVRRRYRKRIAGEDPPNAYEIDVLSKDGGTVPVEITAASVEYDDEPATVSIVRDISERRERQRELERQNERLEEFVSIVSHDLRNPLNVAIGRLELVAEECDSEHLAVIERAHDRMVTMIDDLLTLARQGETPTEVTAVDLAGCAEASWGNVQTADATLVTDTDRAVLADRGRLAQLFENLIGNSVEHGSPGSQSEGDDTDDAAEHGDDGVTVTVGDLPDGFYVEDDGPGIPEDERETVFESGYSTTEDGTGFGLSIVRQIADAHDWEVRVTDGADGGARFEITGVEFDE